jgi:hypothetical protein
MTKKIDECDCCQFSPVEVTRYTSQFPGEPTEAWYCDLCAGTITSREASGRGGYERTVILKTICHVGNAIIAAIKAPSTADGGQK